MDLLFSFPFLLLIDAIFQVHSVYDLYLFVNKVLSVKWVFVFILCLNLLFGFIISGRGYDLRETSV